MPRHRQNATPNEPPTVGEKLGHGPSSPINDSSVDAIAGAQSLQPKVINMPSIESDPTLPYVEKFDRVIYRRTPTPPSNPFNVKNWADIDCYPAPEELSLAQWRWEFLRRDKGYRDFWISTQRLINRGWETESELDYHVGSMFCLNRLIDPTLEAHDGDTRLFTYRYHMARWLADPNFGDEEIELANAHPPPPPGISSPELTVQNFIEDVSWDEEVLLVAIRPRNLLKPQLSAISQICRARIKDRGIQQQDVDLDKAARIRLRPEKYRDYLRVLDARDAMGPFDSSWKAIAKRFSQERAGMTIDRARGLHKQAIETQRALVATPFVT